MAMWVYPSNPATQEAAVTARHDRKRQLSTVEKMGLEYILGDFMKAVCRRDYDFSMDDDVFDEIVWHDDCVSILNGTNDTFVFGNYAVDEVWCTYGGSILLTAYDLTTAPDTDKHCYDPYQVTENYDLLSACKTVCFFLA